MLSKIITRVFQLVAAFLVGGLLSNAHAQHCEPDLRWLKHLCNLGLNEEVISLSECIKKSSANDTFKLVMADWLRKKGEISSAIGWYHTVQLPIFYRSKGLSLVRLNGIGHEEVKEILRRYPLTKSKEDSLFLEVSMVYHQICKQLNSHSPPFHLIDSLAIKLAIHESEFSEQIRNANASLMRLKYPNMTKATLLSIVPGLGKWYVGRKGEALASFLINSLFAVSTLELNHRLGITHVSTVTVGLAGLAFYWGGIIGTRRSVRSVWNRNKTMYEEKVNKLLDAQLDALLQPSTN